MELKTLVFEKSGKRNTDATLRIAKERALALGITQVVVASSQGYTARRAHAIFAPEGIQVIAVTICHGWESEGWPMPAQEKAALQELGVTVHTGVHALGDGVGSAFSEKYGGRVLEEIFREDAKFTEKRAQKAPGTEKYEVSGLDEEEKALIEARLKKLGYIS